jgi:hypothetical protein
MGVCVNKKSIDIVHTNNNFIDNNIKKNDENNNENEIIIQINYDDNLNNNEDITNFESGPILKILKQNVKQ